MERSSVGEPVLVAVDGSPVSLAALDWAVEYAEANDLPITVVTAAAERSTPMSGSPTSYIRAIEEAEHSTRDRVQQVIQHRLRGKAVRYDHVVSVAGLHPMLRRHSVNARVAVVGTRPSTGFGRWFRRSNTNRITGSLACPVVSVTVGADVASAQDSRHLASA